jgi:phosphoglycolate phosphatase-like HAD superfamily hydrolase
MKTIIPRYTDYIFDFDNTLADTSRGYRLAFSVSFREFGLPYDPAKYDEYIRTPLSQLFEKYCRGCTCRYRDFAAMVMSTYDRNYKDAAEMFPDAVACIKALAFRGARLGIVSNSYEQHIRTILREHGLEDCFVSIVGLERMALQKPNPYGFQLCVREMDAPLNSTLAVGDSPDDIYAARNAGLDTALIDRNGVIGPGCGPKYLLASLLEVPRL